LLGRFWLSPLSMLLVSLIGAAAAGCVTTLLLARPGRPLATRLSEFVSILSDDTPAGGRGSLTRAFFDRAERPFARAAWWSRFNEELEIARIRMPAVQVVLWTAVLTIASAWILTLVGGARISALPALTIPFAVRTVIKFKLKRQRNQFAEQLPENLQVLASALRAGHSFVGALSVVVDESDEPSKREFRRVVADEQLGVPLDDALMVVVRRMDNRDLEQVALVAALQREAGGNSAEVLDRVTETVRGRFEVRRLVQTLTAQGRMSRWILSLLPGGLLAVITLLNPNYTEPLYKTTAGQLMLALGGVMVCAGSLAIKKIINIKV
jgi:tight adherence protein B